MIPLAGRPEQAVLGPGKSLVFPLSVRDARGCLRAIATGDSEVEELVLRLDDDQEKTLEQTEQQGRVALLYPDGPFCLEQPGSYRLRVTVRRGRGRVLLMAWQAN